MPKQALHISTPTSRTFELIDIADIQVGDYVLVKTGSQIPVDGKIVNGEGVINEASTTGISKINFKSQAQQMIMIKSGNIKIFQLSTDGQEQLLRVLSAGEYAGERWLFGQKNETLYVQARVDSEVCLIRH